MIIMYVSFSAGPSVYPGSCCLGHAADPTPTEDVSCMLNAYMHDIIRRTIVYIHSGRSRGIHGCHGVPFEEILFTLAIDD